MTPDTNPPIVDTTMPLRTVPPEVPRRPPHTCLYLDDLEEIRDLFLELAAQYRKEIEKSWCAS